MLLAAPLLAPVAVAMVLSSGFDPVAHEATLPLRHRSDDFVGANACRTCHPDHHASWSGTFHSTMTQLPGPETVTGVFDGRSVSNPGGTARPFRRGDAYWMEVPDGPGRTREAAVELTVGSRRYQQYFERTAEGNLQRLPILWHMGERRWLPLSTVFLDDDHADWGRYQALWNANCVFCHNTGPRPGLVRAPLPDGTPPVFESAVAELGIACESCHGPGGEHVARHEKPWERYASWTSEGGDASIVNPARLDQERSVSVCGQCHGQRLANPLEAIDAWMRTGPTFRSGDLLTDHATPLVADTPSIDPTDPEMIRVRFWGDGTPRLTAYEYQGVVSSACYAEGELTCLSCHAMHEGDPKGQLRPDRLGDAACTSCHEEIAADVPAHTRHGAGSSGSSCVECHMPRVVYGILDIHRSHRIEVPDPARDARSGRPNACTLCHLDESLGWAATEMTRMFERPFEVPSFRADRAPLSLADSIASVLAGDPVTRAVYARAMGRTDAAVRPREKGFLRVHLGMTLGDSYPSIRLLALRSLRRLEAELDTGVRFDGYDHLAGEPERVEMLRSLLPQICRAAKAELAPVPDGFLVRKDGAPDFQGIDPLFQSQAAKAISIGE